MAMDIKKTFSLVFTGLCVLWYEKHAKLKIYHKLLSSVWNLVNASYTYRSCSAMENHAVKLLVDSFCVDVNGRGCLGQQSISDPPLYLYFTFTIWIIATSPFYFCTMLQFNEFFHKLQTVWLDV